MEIRQEVRDIGGLRLSFRAAGPDGGTPVLLLHGGAVDGSVWDELLTGLADQCRVYVPDLRGHGASDRPGEYSLELMRDDVVGLLDALRLDRVAVVGHSMGGVVAYLLAEAYPDRVAALVLAETPPPVPAGLPMPGSPLAPSEPGPAEPTSTAPTPAGPTTAQPTVYDPAVRPAVIAQLNAPNPAWWVELADVTAPTLVVAGGPDSHLPQDGLERFAARFPNGDIVTIPGGGHRVHTSRPAEFQAAVRDFLSGLPR